MPPRRTLWMISNGLQFSIASLKMTLASSRTLALSSSDLALWYFSTWISFICSSVCNYDINALLVTEYIGLTFSMVQNIEIMWKPVSNRWLHYNKVPVSHTTIMLLLTWSISLLALSPFPSLMNIFVNFLKLKWDDPVLFYSLRPNCKLSYSAYIHNDIVVVQGGGVCDFCGLDWLVPAWVIFWDLWHLVLVGQGGVHVARSIPWLSYLGYSETKNKSIS